MNIKRKDCSTGSDQSLSDGLEYYSEALLQKGIMGLIKLTLILAGVAYDASAQAMQTYGKTNQTNVLETFDSEKGFLGYALSFIESMMDKGTDRYGEVHSPMFVSILDVRTGNHPGKKIPAVPTQRQWDRAHMGGDLQMDIALLEAMEQATRITGDKRYLTAKHEYIHFFLEHATKTPTGLWPWGEHAYWDYFKEELGSMASRNQFIHEYSDDPDEEFWHLAWDMNPQAVIGQADGVINHIVNLDDFTYNRHARIDEPLPVPREEGMSALDFPRQGGYFIRLWAFVYAKTGEERYIDWIERMLDHFEEIMIPEYDLLPGISIKTGSPRGSDENPSAGQSRQVAHSLDRARPYLEGTATGERSEALYQRLEGGLMVTDVSSEPPSIGFGQRRHPSSPWEGLLPDYDGPPLREAATYRGEGALNLVKWYRLVGDEAALQEARNIAQAYADVYRIPWENYDHVRAGVMGMTINLMLDMHELDGGEQWLPVAERYARWAIERLYYNGFFLGATNRWYYDANLRVSLLVYSLVRLHAVEQDLDIDVPPMYFRPSR